MLSQSIVQTCCIFSEYLVGAHSEIMEKLRHPNFQKVSRDNPNKKKITPKKLMENVTELSFI